MGTERRQRTTACISEAFDFLSSPEYSVDNNEGTWSQRNSLQNKFITADEDNGDINDNSSVLISNGIMGSKKSWHENSSSNVSKKNNFEEEYTIITYVDTESDKENSLPHINNQSDSGFIQEVSFDVDTNHPEEYVIETYIEDSNPGHIVKGQGHVQNDRLSTGNIGTNEPDPGDFSLDSNDNTEGEVVLRRWADSSKLDLNTSANSSPITGLSRSNNDSGIMRGSSSNVDKQIKNLGRGTQVISNAFSFLKEMEDINDAEKKEVPNVMERTKQLSIISNQSMDQGTSIQNGSGSSKILSSESVSSGSIGSGSSHGKVIRRQKSENLDRGDDSGDSSDEDTGIYNESFRNSCWVQVDQNQLISHSKNTKVFQQPSIDEKDEDVFSTDNDPSVYISHKRSESTTTTASESEFKREFVTKRRAVVQRHDSQQEYHRMSTRFYDQEREITIIKEDGDEDFGLHILDSHPAIITCIDKGSPSDRAGITEGQIVISVNGVNVLKATHQEIVQLIQKKGSIVQLEVASSDVYHIRDIDAPILTGYMSKLSNSTFVKNWRRRYFVLRQDNCLYYYKSDQDQDPLGALPVLNYHFSKNIDSNKENCFKAEKYGARSYHFVADTREEMARWVGALNEAASKAKSKRDNWMDITSHNVGLPALEIRKPDCSGYLSKCGRTMKGWSRRYCVLKDACMYYYKNMNSQSAQGMAHLHGYTVDPVGVNSKKYSILLRPPEAQMKSFTFCAENDTDKKRWIDALNKSIQRWIKVD